MPVSLLFHIIEPNLAQILPLRPHPLSYFFADFQLNMLGDSVLINNLCCNPVVLKKRVKPQKLQFWVQSALKKSQHGPHPK